MMILKLLAQWARAYARAVSHDGLWVYAPPLAISASSPIWRMAPPPRVVEDVAAQAARPAVTDPRLVAARRAGFRLILNESKA